MDVVVKSRHCTVEDEFREYALEKVTRLEKLDDHAMRVEVELSTEKNPRLHDQAARVEITVRRRGPVVRAEASAAECTAAFDLAIDKLMAQLRKSADRRRIHRGQHTPTALHEAVVAPHLSLVDSDLDSSDDDVPVRQVAGIEVVGDGPLVVREKLHVAAAMGLGQALLEMELLGHDFFLFVDSDLNLPSVVYRRRGYDYGVVRLDALAPAARTS